MARNEKLYITDILNSIYKIEKYIKNTTFHEFCENDQIIDSVVRNLEIIGEAAKHISESTKNENKDIPWRQIIGLRNMAIHEYFGLDNEIIWKIITEELILVKLKLEEINRSAV